jgi:hypothetical protein
VARDEEAARRVGRDVHWQDAIGVTVSSAYDGSEMAKAPPDAPMIELLSWLSVRTRTYDETIEAWHSHCPRLTVWEDALGDGLILVQRATGGSTVTLTERGRATLAHAGSSR